MAACLCTGMAPQLFAKISALEPRGGSHANSEISGKACAAALIKSMSRGKQRQAFDFYREHIKIKGQRNGTESWAGFRLTA